MRKLFFAVLLAASCALALDVSGRWWGEAVAAGSTQPVYITFIQEGNSIRGSGGPSPNEQSALTGEVDGKRISFDVLPGGRTPLHFDLAPEGGWLKGTIKVQRNGQTVTGSVSLRRRSN